VIESIAGWVRQVIHHSGDFYVLKVYVDETEITLTARGNLYGLLQVLSGVPIELTGNWKKHPKYGDQFAIQSWKPWAKRAEDVERFLHLCIEGFHADRDLARQVASIGLGAFQMLSEGYKAVADELDLPDDHEGLQRGVLGWQRATALRDLSGLLRAGGLGGMDIQAAMMRFGMAAATIIQENPYRLMEVLLDFPKVDRLAMRLGVDTDNPHRMEGAILWAVREEGRQGHLFLPRGDITKSLEWLVRRHTIIALPEVSVDEAVDRLVEHGALVLEPGTGVYLPSLYGFERKSAKLLAALLAPADIDVDLKPFLDSYEKSNRISLSESQRAAVESLGEHRVLALTGLPGTGKTTAVRALVKLFEEAKVTYALMAPTGIAAKRLAAVTGRPASTIHRALGYDGDNWRLNESNRYVVDAVIVDEMSMVDQELFYRLLVALRPETILVLVGDDAQLPSVGPGNVLRELVSSEVPHVRLTQIFRQSSKGEIVINSHRIDRGEMPILAEAKDKSEFRFVRISEEDRIVSLIVGMAEKLKSRDANFQVLAPKYDGPVGVTHLNEMLRDRLNPPGLKEWKWGKSCHFRLGDRLMVVQNDYLRSVYNGDMGKLVSIGQEELVVKIHGVGPRDPDILVSFPFDIAAERLKLAYAISVHKSQGSEFDTVILPVVRSQGRMLQRNLLYTAVTRARKRVWLLGEEDAIRRAVANNPVIQRNTVLAEAVGVQVTHGRRPETEGRLDAEAEETPGKTSV
jgi:exodeoxyribonuclease V alpha subunit